MGMGRMGREASGGSRKKNKLRIDFKRNASMAPAHFKLSKSHKSRAVDGEWNGPLDGWTDGQWPALSRGKWNCKMLLLHFPAEWLLGSRTRTFWIYAKPRSEQVGLYFMSKSLPPDPLDAPCSMPADSRLFRLFPGCSCWWVSLCANKSSHATGLWRKNLGRGLEKRRAQRLGGRLHGVVLV